MLLSQGEYAATIEKIGKINARAAKRGFTGKLDVTGTPVEQKSKNALGIEVTEILVETTVTGEPPSYGGWRFLATLDWDAEAGLIVRTAPGVSTVDRTGLREGWCAHCKQNRHRNKTFLVGSDKGEQVQVGSTCIKDFLGWAGNPVFFTTDDITEQVESFLGAGSYVERRWTAETVLAAAWAAIQVDGYVPASAYNGQPTKGTVLQILDPHTKWDRAKVIAYRPYVAKSQEQAKIILDWLRNVFSGQTEYAINLLAVAKSDTVSARNLGLLVSAPQAWAKAQERDLVRRKERAEILNEYSGAVKDRLTLKVTIQSIRYIDGDWGTSTLYVLLGDDRRVYKWFSTNGALGETTDGSVYTITGTVKKHEEYNGNKSTVLTRCKVLAVEKKGD